MSDKNTEQGKSTKSTQKVDPVPEPIPAPDPKLRGWLTEEKQPSSARVSNTDRDKN